jgi:hypothetical protein
MNFWAIACISLFLHTNNAYEVDSAQQHCYDFQKTYTLAGFEPGPSFLEAYLMSTARRSQGDP